jgi:hypothetical protein
VCAVSQFGRFRLFDRSPRGFSPSCGHMTCVLFVRMVCRAQIIVFTFGRNTSESLLVQTHYLEYTDCVKVPPHAACAVMVVGAPFSLVPSSHAQVLSSGPRI